MKTLVIIPAYNEEENILNVCNKINKVEGLDYIVVNDSSTDSTLKICIDNKLNHINLVSNLGIGGAVQTGYKYALEHNYDIAVQFDGDGQHDINYIKDICKPIINKEADLCIGSRYIKNKKSEFQSTPMRRFGKNIISIILRIFTGKKITDPTSGFRAANKKIIEIFVNDYPTDYPEPESLVTLIKSGYKIKEIPVKMNERQGGKSSIKAFKSIQYMIKVSLAIIINSVSLKRRR